MRPGISPLYLTDKRKRARTSCVLIVILLLVFVSSLCVGVDDVEIYSPGEVLRCYGLAISHLLPDSPPLSNTEALATEPHYYQIISRLGINTVTGICGALLALAGAVYQLAFRNPVAAPTMLGVSSGVRLGLIIAVLQFDTLASSLVGHAYFYAIICALLVLLTVFVLSYLAAPKCTGLSIGIVDLLLVGTIISSAITAFSTYVQDYVLTEEQYNIFWGLSEVLTVEPNTLTIALLAAACILALIPLHFCRFSLNALSLSDDNAKMSGINSGAFRLIVIFLATLLMVVAQLLVGSVSMLCLVVPHISRMLFGAEFSKQLPANILLGAIFLIVCRFCCSLIPFVGYGFPLGTLVSIVLLPAFVWLVALQQRKWSVE